LPKLNNNSNNSNNSNHSNNINNSNHSNNDDDKSNRDNTSNKDKNLNDNVSEPLIIAADYKIFPDFKNPNHKSIILTSLNNLINGSQNEFKKKISETNYQKETQRDKVNYLERNKVNQHYKSRRSLEPISQLKFTSSKEIIINSTHPKLKKNVNRSASNPNFQNIPYSQLGQHGSVKSLSDLSSFWENNDRKSVPSQPSIISENNFYNNSAMEVEENQNKLKEIENKITLTIDEEDLIKHFVLIENWMDFDHVN